jgi:hypothetical protein
MGNFTSVTPNAKALKAVENLIACGVRDRKVTMDYKLYGHRDSTKSSTDCPGQAFYDIIIQAFYDIIIHWPHYDKHGPPPSGAPRVNSHSANRTTLRKESSPTGGRL